MDFAKMQPMQNPFMTKMQPMQNPLQNPRFFIASKKAKKRETHIFHKN